MSIVTVGCNSKISCLININYVGRHWPFVRNLPSRQSPEKPRIVVSSSESKKIMRLKIMLIMIVSFRVVHNRGKNRCNLERKIQWM